MMVRRRHTGDDRCYKYDELNCGSSKNGLFHRETDLVKIWVCMQGNLFDWLVRFICAEIVVY